MNAEQLRRIEDGQGFIAALDQSGGSTPIALANYGIEKDAYHNEDEMFDMVHQMRARIITSPNFTSQRVLGAIIFRGTMERQIEGMQTADYLWQTKGIVPFLKIDNGLTEEVNGVQTLKPMPELDSLLELAQSMNIFGTKMRSVIKSNNQQGINEVLDQQFALAKQIIAAGFVPIIEPEVDINAPDKAAAEQTLFNGLSERINDLNSGQRIMLKLTLPEVDNLYLDITQHPQVIRTVALSGGYSLEEAVGRLKRNKGIIASFSRVLAAGLKVDQTDEQFNTVLDKSIEEAYRASLS